MVGLAFSYSVKNKLKLSNFFLSISIPITLLPFRRAFYYWTKSVNVLFGDPGDLSKAYELAKKVKPDNLYTDNNKCFFFSFYAAILSDSGDKEQARHYLEMAQHLPHKKEFDHTIEQLKEEIEKIGEEL
jgi:hypothetical protein